METNSVETNTCYALLMAFKAHMEDKILTIESLYEIVNNQIESLKVIYNCKNKPSIKDVSLRIYASVNRFPAFNQSKFINTSPLLRRIFLSKKPIPFRLFTANNKYYLATHEKEAFEAYNDSNVNGAYCLPYLKEVLDRAKLPNVCIVSFTLTLYLDDGTTVDISPYSNEKERHELGL